MLLLVSTTDKLQMVTSAAASIDWYTSWVDASNANPPVVQGDTASRSSGNVATATTTDIVAAAASTELRRVKFINVRNKHASTSCDITIVQDVSGTDVELVKVTLRAGETLIYTETTGWYVVENTTRERQVRLGADVTSASTTAAEATGLTIATGVGTFVFEYYLILQSAATTTGHKFDVNHSGTVTSHMFWIEWLTAATTASDDVPDQDHTAAPGGVFSGYSRRAKGTAGAGVTTDVDTANADVLYVIRGITICSVDGNLQLYWAPEAAANATLKAGSSLVLHKTADV